MKQILVLLLTLSLLLITIIITFTEIRSNSEKKNNVNSDEVMAQNSFTHPSNAQSSDIGKDELESPFYAVSNKSTAHIATEFTNQNKCEVGGCGGHLCLDPNELNSFDNFTCGWHDHFVCYSDYGPVDQAMRICERQNDGECGWTQNNELQSCLAEYGFSPNQTSYTLRISKRGDGEGILTARGDNFFESCGADCSEIQLGVPPRAKVSFEGLPEEGSVFWDWNDEVTCFSSENPCEVVVLEPAEISANFSTGHFFSKTFQVPPKVETTFEYAETGYSFTVPEGAALRDTTLTFEVKFNSRGESKTNVIFPQNADWAESVVIKVSAYNRETWCNFMDDTLLQQACKQSYSEN